jgi:hypothetical protein
MGLLYLNGVFATTGRGKNAQEHITTYNMTMNRKTGFVSLNFMIWTYFLKHHAGMYPTFRGNMCIYPILWVGSEMINPLMLNNL